MFTEGSLDRLVWLAIAYGAKCVLYTLSYFQVVGARFPLAQLAYLIGVLTIPAAPTYRYKEYKVRLPHGMKIINYASQRWHSIKVIINIYIAILII